MIPGLIDKQDSFEIIRSQIGAILATETASQQNLAVIAGEDPDKWKLRIYEERSNPWEQFLLPLDEVDPSPIVNVWYQNSTFNLSASNVMERQQAEGIFNIDCYGYAVSSDDPSGGHNPGDRESAFEVQRAVRLVRNILMAADYTYLGLRGLIGLRWPENISIFQPQKITDTGHQINVEQVVGARIELRVTFNEFSPQAEPETLELASIDVIRAEDGELLVEADYEYPLP